MNAEPLVSIITVCYNSEKVISSALESVLKQSYKNIEHIVIDGLSQDSTLNVIKEYEPLYEGRMVIVSEKDEGIYDAINKGIKLAKGSIIGILNSDDWYSEGAIEMIVQNHEENIDIYYGNIYQIKKIGNDYYKYRQNACSNDLKQISTKMSISHSSCFVSRRWYKRIKYDNKYIIAADYKFILESYLSGANFKYIDYYFTYMRVGGISSKNKLQVLVEEFDIRKIVCNKRDLFLFIKGFLSIYYHKGRKLVAKIVLSKRYYSYLEKRNWTKLL